MERRINPETHRWTPGERYRFLFESQNRTGRAEIDRIVQKLVDDPRLRVDRWTWDGRTLDLEATALREGSPVIVIVYAVLALGALFLVYLTVKEVRVIARGDASLPADPSSRAGSITLLAVGGLLLIGATVGGVAAFSKAGG